MQTSIAKKLLRWYVSRRRNLPWRERPRPYAVWVAEIMAQQTRLESMLPYYRRWMRRFPSVKVLAKAREQEVLTLWEGLGYYSRARSLRRAAQILVKEHGGRLPQSAVELQCLPGIGRYTAGAIASVAFGADEPAVDGNAVRVLARLFDVREPAGTATGQARFWQLAAENLPKGKAAEYNQALMDLGAQVCSPRQPKCGVCPLNRECIAFKLGNQHDRPVRLDAKQSPVRSFAAAVIMNSGKVLVNQRPERGLLAGMWEFPNVEVRELGRSGARLRNTLQKEFQIELKAGDVLGEYEHTYSHFEARLRAYVFTSEAKVPTGRPYRWVAIGKLGSLPMGKLDRSIANSLRNAVG